MNLFEHHDIIPKLIPIPLFSSIYISEMFFSINDAIIDGAIFLITMGARWWILLVNIYVEQTIRLLGVLESFYNLLHERTMYNHKLITSYTDEHVYLRTPWLCKKALNIGDILYRSWIKFQLLVVGLKYC